MDVEIANLQLFFKMIQWIWELKSFFFLFSFGGFSFNDVSWEMLFQLHSRNWLEKIIKLAHGMRWINDDTFFIIIIFFLTYVDEFPN